jgi:hypothetical protein
MSPIYVPGKVVLRKTWQPMDADAAAYITAVETADGQALEEKTKIAIDNFVLGCKADGIWSALKASCILAGARTLTGALVPLVGTAPTNVGGLFVSGDYNRKTGILSASGKSLNTNRSNSSDPQNSNHMSAWVSEVGGNPSLWLDAGGGTAGGNTLRRAGSLGVVGVTRNANTSWPGAASGAIATANTFAGVVRFASNDLRARVNGVAYTRSDLPSDSPANTNVIVFNGSTARLAFYSIGESLDLALLDARVTDLINAFGAAIP